jgi:hypothetical protein
VLGRYTAYFNDFNLFCRPVWARGCTTVQYNFANCQRLVGTAGRLPQIVVTGRMMGYLPLAGSAAIATQELLCGATVLARPRDKTEPRSCSVSSTIPSA